MRKPFVLTTGENQSLTDVFGPQVPLHRIRFFWGGAFGYGASRTVARSVYVERRWESVRNEPAFRSLLVHEMVHIWQFHHIGWRYAVGSLWEQFVAWLTVRTRLAAYHYVLKETRSFQTYGYEQQAQIIQDWFVRTYCGPHDGPTKTCCLNFNELGRQRADQLVERYLTDVRDWSSR